MAYKKRELEEKALSAIKKHKLVFIDDVVSFLPCSRATFYNHGLDKLDAIKEVLEANRVQMKSGLRKKWYEGENATTQIALYKLLGNDDELRRLTGQTIMGDQDKPLQHVVQLKTEDLDSDPIE